MARHNRRAHRNPNGHWCWCPFGGANAEPYDSPQEIEKYGSKEAMWHEAAKIDWLRGREDMQDLHWQTFLDELEKHFPNHDKLYPWLVGQAKKQKVQARSWHPGNYQDAYPFQYTTARGENEGLEADDLDMLNDYMKHQKKTGNKGINIDQHEIGQILPEAAKWDAGGEAVYDDGQHKVVHLRNRRDLRQEGRKMNHCIGSQTYGYHTKQKNGEGLYYSIRDSHSNQPFGTVEMARSQDEYYKCPNGHFTPGKQTYYDDKTGERLDGPETHCDECGSKLFEGYYPNSETDYEPGVKAFPVHLGKMAKKPDARFMEPSQFYGPHDGGVDSDAVRSFNDFMSRHGHNWISPDNDEEEEEFEPWWDNEYHAPAPRTVDDFLHYNDDEYEYGRMALDDDEYDRAVSDAHEHELDAPDLHVDNDIDIPSIFDDLKDEKVEPDKIERLWQAMRDHGHENEWDEQAQNWLDEDYHPYVDPYRSEKGPGFGVQSPIPSEPTIPRVGPDGRSPQMFPTQPNYHYPEGFPQEDYLARNLLHHLNQYSDPQTGESLGQSGMEYRYPHIDPGNPAHPQFTPGDVPIPEQTGPYVTDREDPRYNWRRERIELPYGRGDTDFDPSSQGSGTQEELDIHDPQGGNRRRRTPNNPDYRHDGPPTQLVPRGPEEAFGPGSEDVRWQRPLPGFENQVELQTYPRGEQQGNLWSPSWYHDRAKQRENPPGWVFDYQTRRARPTKLPPELFPPDRYHYAQDKPANGQDPWRDQQQQQDAQQNQMQMWDYGSDYGLDTPEAKQYKQERGQYPARINTQGEPDSGWGSFGPPGSARPMGPWNASVKEADAWEDFEHQQKEKGLQNSERFGRVHRFTSSRPYEKLPDHDWRLPVIYSKSEDRMFVGQPGMMHTDLARNFGMDDPWKSDGKEVPGYIDTDQQVGEGGLHFFGSYEPPNPDELHDWVEQHYGVRSDTGQAPEEDYENPDAWVSSYHPAQDDEWVAGDEPTFTATIPESRWHA